MGWNLCYRNVWLETDSASAFQLIDQDVQATHVHVALVKVIHILNEEWDIEFRPVALVKVIHNLNEEWEIEFRHVFHEADKCVDRLAKACHRLLLRLTFFDSLPACISVDFWLTPLGIVAQDLFMCNSFGLRLWCI